MAAFSPPTKGFAAAGFPGADKEYELARDYFAPAIARRRAAGRGDDDVLVDMSCATGELERAPGRGVRGPASGPLLVVEGGDVRHAWGDGRW